MSINQHTRQIPAVVVLSSVPADHIYTPARGGVHGGAPRQRAGSNPAIRRDGVGTLQHQSDGAKMSWV